MNNDDFRHYAHQLVDWMAEYLKTDFDEDAPNFRDWGVQLGPVGHRLVRFGGCTFRWRRVHSP